MINDKFCQLEMREMQNTIAQLREEKAPKTTYDNDDSLDLDSEEYDLDGF